MAANHINNAGDISHPPLHSIILISSTIILCLHTLPTLNSIDEYATINSFTTTISDAISVKSLYRIRYFFALVGIATTAHNILHDKCEVDTNYLPASHLKHITPFYLQGIRTQAFFTAWAWNLLTLSNILSGTVAYLAFARETVETKNDDDIPRWLLRAALITHEMAIPTECAIAAIVTYIIWPYKIERNKIEGTDDNKHTKKLTGAAVIIMHNACVVFIFAEMCFLGRIPLVLSHLPLVPVPGVTYIAFSWWCRHSWGLAKGDGAQFLYLFLDTSLGWVSTGIIAGLVGLFLSFFVVAAGACWIVQWGGLGVLGQVAVFACGVKMLCRFRE